MYKSQAFLIATIPFALLSFYLLFYGMVLTSNKIPDLAEFTQFQKDHQPWFSQPQQPPKSKVIFILIDGLRFDYMFNETDHPLPSESWVDHQYNRFLDILNKSPENSVKLKVFVDPPTRTADRVPCMMTGNIPLKMIGLQAFGGLPVLEDNIPAQITKTGRRKTYFAGDPLWMDYFPNNLVSDVVVRGFDIKDTDVDVEPIEYLSKIAKENNFDMILGHMLGVDHMGHLKGLLDPSIPPAKRMIEDFLIELLEGMDDETTLIITGDHGAVVEGEHGLDNYEEIYTPLIAYHKKGFHKLNQPNMKKVMRSLEEQTTVNQIDLVPTLAMLLGTPFPFSNLGQVINDLYPAGYKLPEVESCPENNFALQIFYDNYATSMQIMNFMNEKQLRSKIFDPIDVAAVKASFGELENQYKAIQNIINDPKKCQETREMITEIVLKGQKFAEQVYPIVKYANSFDLVISGAAIFSFVLIMLSYPLTVQYIYTSGYKEKHMTINFKQLLQSSKSLLPLLILNIIGALAAWKFNPIYAYPLTACLLITETWFLGSIIISFLNLKSLLKNKSPAKHHAISNGQSENDIEIRSNIELVQTAEKSNESNNASIRHQDNIALIPAEAEERLPQTILGHKFFMFKTPLQTLGACLIIVYLLYLIHLKNFFGLQNYYFITPAPFVASVILTYLFAKNFAPKFAYPILAFGVLAFTGIAQYTDLVDGHNFKLRLGLGLVLVAEWTFREIYHMRSKLKATKLFSVLQLITWGLVTYYQVRKLHPDHLTDIVLPRIIWGMMASSLVVGYVQKANRSANKRNFQLYLVLFMVLLRKDWELIYFGNLLHLMSIATEIFVKAKVKNYLYPFFIGFLSYIGLFYLLLTDYFVMMKFECAFVGLNEFHPMIGPIFYLIYLLSSFILATIFISHYNQGISSRKVKREEDDIVGGTKLQRKRNVFLVALVYGIIMMSSNLKVWFLREHHLDTAFEKFFIDAAFYFYFLICGYFLLSK